MFCFQCEQTMRPEAGRTDAAAGCATAKGVCGKDEVTADLQDLLIHQLKGIAQYRTRLGALGGADHEADSFVLFALFTTLTNVNFNRTRFVALIAEAARIRDRLRAAYEAACQQAGQEPEALDGPAAFVPADTLPGLLAQACHGSRRARRHRDGGRRRHRPARAAALRAQGRRRLRAPRRGARRAA